MTVRIRFWTMWLWWSLLRDLGVHIVAYADDLVLLIEAKWRAAVKNKANVALARVTHWYRQDKHAISLAKTKFMYLNGKKDRQRRLSVTTEGQPVRDACTDQCLSPCRSGWKTRLFAQHLKMSTTKCLKILLGLRQAIEAECGIRVKNTSIVYKSIMEAYAGLKDLQETTAYHQEETPVGKGLRMFKGCTKWNGFSNK